MDRTARPLGRAVLPRSEVSCLSPRDSSAQRGMIPYQDEIGITLCGCDGNARLLAVGRQNERVERIVRCARIANGNPPINGCGRYLSPIK